jgi:acyl-coenzyme A thioesterase PaaI-like protein
MTSGVFLIFKVNGGMNMEVDRYCFACGIENPIGLKLVFETNQEGVIAHFIPTKEYQGYVDMLHGGIISTLLDEAMAHAVIAKGHQAVTARMEVQFKKPIMIGEILCLKGRINQEKGRLIETYGEIEQNGQITAAAKADFLIVK